MLLRKLENEIEKVSHEFVWGDEETGGEVAPAAAEKAETADGIPANLEHFVTMLGRNSGGHRSEVVEAFTEHIVPNASLITSVEMALYKRAGSDSYNTVLEEVLADEELKAMLESDEWGRRESKRNAHAEKFFEAVFTKAYSRLEELEEAESSEARKKKDMRENVSKMEERLSELAKSKHAPDDVFKGSLEAIQEYASDLEGDFDFEAQQNALNLFAVGTLTTALSLYKEHVLTKLKEEDEDKYATAIANLDEIDIEADGFEKALELVERLYDVLEVDVDAATAEAADDGSKSPSKEEVQDALLEVAGESEGISDFVKNSLDKPVLATLIMTILSILKAFKPSILSGFIEKAEMESTDNYEVYTNWKKGLQTISLHHHVTEPKKKKAWEKHQQDLVAVEEYLVDDFMHGAHHDIDSRALSAVTNTNFTVKDLLDKMPAGKKGADGDVIEEEDLPKGFMRDNVDFFIDLHDLVSTKVGDDKQYNKMTITQFLATNFAEDALRTRGGDDEDE